VLGNPRCLQIRRLARARRIAVCATCFARAGLAALHGANLNGQARTDAGNGDHSVRSVADLAEENTMTIPAGLEAQILRYYHVEK
jgi:hypothetical protein